eukprot:752228-Hanusia_phi.AAC.2
MQEGRRKGGSRSYSSAAVETSRTVPRNILCSVEAKLRVRAGPAYVSSSNLVGLAVSKGEEVGRRGRGRRQKSCTTAEKVEKDQERSDREAGMRVRSYTSNSSEAEQATETLRSQERRRKQDREERGK